MDIMSLLASLLSGGVGGNIVGALLKNRNLGPMLNSVLGAIGGGIGGQFLAGRLGTGGSMAGNVGVSAATGVVLTLIASYVKKRGSPAA